MIADDRSARSARSSNGRRRLAEVDKAKALAETDFWTALADVDGKAEALGHYETALGDFRRLDTLAARLTAVTADDVARAVRTYLVSSRRTIVIAEPEDDEDDAEADADADADDRDAVDGGRA